MEVVEDVDWALVGVDGEVELIVYLVKHVYYRIAGYWVARNAHQHVRDARVEENVIIKQDYPPQIPQLQILYHQPNVQGLVLPCDYQDWETDGRDVRGGKIGQNW